jgi:hypothetical protein
MSSESSESSVSLKSGLEPGSSSGGETENTELMLPCPPAARFGKPLLHARPPHLQNSLGTDALLNADVSHCEKVSCIFLTRGSDHWQSQKPTERRLESSAASGYRKKVT